MVKLTSSNNSPKDVARKYISLVLNINDIKVSKREMDLLTFIALNRDISSGGKKEEFMEQFKTTKPTIGNLVFSLKKKGLLIKQDGKICLPKSIIIHPEMKIYVELKG